MTEKKEEENGNAFTMNNWRKYLFNLAVQMPLVAVLAIFLWLQRQDEAKQTELFLLREQTRIEQYERCNEELKATLKEMIEVIKEIREKGQS